jgi:hypothetical protein
MLTSEQKNIAATKQVTMNRTADEVIAFLNALSSWDKVVERRARFWGWAAVLAGLGGGIGGFIWLGVKKHHPERGGGLLVATVIAVIILARIWSKWSSQNLADNFRIAALPFLTVLREDMEPNQRMQVKLDLREAVIPEKKINESAPYKLGMYHRVIDRTYRDAWFEGRTTLADDTEVSWNVTEQVFERERTKRNARGKTKTKRKYKKRTLVVVTLNFASKEYTLAEAKDDVKQKKKTITLKGGEKYEGVQKTPAFDILVALMSDAYSRVSVGRTA